MSVCLHFCASRRYVEDTRYVRRQRRILELNKNQVTSLMLHTLQDHQPAIGQVPEANYPKLWKSGRNMVGPGGMSQPDYPHRLAVRRNRLGGRRSGIARPAMPPELVFEESYRTLMQMGKTSEQAWSQAQQMAQRNQATTMAVRQAGYQVTGVIHESNYYGAPQGAPGFQQAQVPQTSGNQTMTNPYVGSSNQHPAAPTFANAQRAGLTTGPARNNAPVPTPRGVVQSGTGASPAAINSARVATHQQRQNVRPPSMVPQSARAERVPVERYYQSVDGNQYFIETATTMPDGSDPRAVRGASNNILLHAIVELIKGGDPLDPLGACMGEIIDSRGTQVFNPNEALAQKIQEMQGRSNGGPSDEEEFASTSLILD